MISSQSFGTSNDHPYILEWGGYGTSELGKFYHPQQIAVDDERNIYVTDTDNSRIQKFSHDGQFLSSWELPVLDSGGEQSPVGIAIYENNVYVVEKYTVQKFDIYDELIKNQCIVNIFDPYVKKLEVYEQYKINIIENLIKNSYQSFKKGFLTSQR